MALTMRWHVNVEVGHQADTTPAIDDLLMRQLPPDTRPVYIGYGSDMRLSIIRLTIDAASRDDASNQGLEIVRGALAATGSAGNPEVRGVAPAT